MRAESCDQTMEQVAVDITAGEHRNRSIKLEIARARRRRTVNMARSDWRFENKEYKGHHVIFQGRNTSMNDSKHHGASAQLWRLRFGGKPDSRRRAVRLAAGVLTVLLLGGLVIWLPKPAAYGRWGFDTSTIDPAVRPGDSFFDHANGAGAAGRIDDRRVGAKLKPWDIRNTVQKNSLHSEENIVAKAPSTNDAPDTDTGKNAAQYRAFVDQDR